MLTDYGIPKEELRAKILHYAEHGAPREGRPDHFMATLVPNFDPARDCTFPLVRRLDGSAAFFCPCCREYHHHGTWEDFEPGVPEGRFAHCHRRGGKPPQMTHYFIVKPIER
jgi:hypothetical protein